jgi:hypothetical protein
VYDKPTGQLLTGSYMDYAMPRADDLPSFTVDRQGHALHAQPAGREGLRRGRRHRLAAGGHQRLGLGATVVTDRGAHAADGYFKGLFETALADGELVTAVRFPVPRRAAYVKFAHRASKYAVVGVFVAETTAGVRVAITGAGATVFRSTAMEAALTASMTPGALDGITVPPDDLNNDAEASAEYRAHLCVVMAKRAVAALR